MDVDTTADQLFDRLLEEDGDDLAARLEKLASEIEAIEQQQRDLEAQHQRLEARRSLLRGITEFRKLELGGGDDAKDVKTQRPATTKDAARNVIDEAPDRIWDAETLHDQLLDRGIATTRSNVRMILQRLMKEDAIQRVAHGRYQSVHARASNLLTQEDEQG